MRFYEIEMMGDLILEKVLNLPTFDSSKDVGRILYLESDGYIYYGSNDTNDWKLLKGIESVDTMPIHDSYDEGRLIYTEDNENLLLGLSDQWKTVLDKETIDNHIGSGGLSEHQAVTVNLAGFMSTSDKDALDNHISHGGTSQHPEATESTAGFLGTGDKFKLNNLDNDYVEVSGDTMQGPLVMSTSDKRENGEIRNIFFDDVDPINSDGVDGDLWIVLGEKEDEEILSGKLVFSIIDESTPYDSTSTYNNDKSQYESVPGPPHIILCNVDGDLYDVIPSGETLPHYITHYPCGRPPSLSDLKNYFNTHKPSRVYVRVDDSGSHNWNDAEPTVSDFVDWVNNETGATATSSTMGDGTAGGTGEKWLLDAYDAVTS